jgi:proteic killer suppression protein
MWNLPQSSRTESLLIRPDDTAVRVPTPKLEDLKASPANRLEALRGSRNGQHSIRINDQWRVCFMWRGGDAYNVEIVDYH